MVRGNGLKISNNFTIPQLRLGSLRKNRRKDPNENPKKPRSLSKHDVEMSCSVCKLKQPTKRSILIKIGRWNRPLKDLEVDQEKIIHFFKSS